MAEITFSRVTAPAGSWSPSLNPDARGYGGKEDYPQPSAWSDGGAFYCYDKGIKNKTLRFQWSSMSKDDFEDLQTFFETVEQSAYNFTFNDIDSASYTARFISGLSWDFTETGEFLIVSFELLIEA